MRIALVVGRFPVLSEVFVLQQVTGLLALGADVQIFAGRPPPGEATHELYRAHDLASRTHYFEDPPAGTLRRASALAARAASAGRARLPLIARTLARSVARGKGASLAPVLRLMGLLSRAPFDVVHAHFGDSGRLCAALPASAAKPVTTFHGYDANVAPRIEGEGEGEGEGKDRPIYRALFSRGDAFTANSRFLRERLVTLGCPADRITILPMGVNLAEWPFSPRSLRPGQPVELLTVGRLVPAKGIGYAIRAVAELQSRGVAVRYRVVGGGEERDALAELIRELGVSGRVELLGPRPHEEVRALYATAHVFVLPSIPTPRGDAEAQGLVVAEAQAAGMPVVVTDTGGVAEGILPDVTGVVCRAADARALAGAIQRILARRDAWPSMGRAGRALVEAKFDLARQNRALFELYESLVATKSAPSRPAGA
jgi:colanic acid/amylovoran biosynthesis glycosyltransferase